MSGAGEETVVMVNNIDVSVAMLKGSGAGEETLEMVNNIDVPAAMLKGSGAQQETVEMVNNIDVPTAMLKGSGARQETVEMVNNIDVPTAMLKDSGVGEETLEMVDHVDVPAAMLKESVAGEETLEMVDHVDVPAAMLKGSHGLSVDFGSSQTKIAYATPLPVGDRVRVHFVSFAKEEYDKALQFIQDTYGDRLKPGELVNVTGINCNQKKVEEKLNVKLNILLESACFIDGFKFLVENYPAETIFHQKPMKIENFARNYKSNVGHTVRLVSQASSGLFTLPPLFQEEDISNSLSEDPRDLSSFKIEYPAMFCYLGSAYQAYKLNEDGTATGMALLPICGRSLLAMGSLLAGTKTFEELMDLASRGSAGKLDVDLGELANICSENEKDSYSDIEGDFLPVFSMGKAFGKNIGDFRREDLAAACVTMTAQAVAAISELRAATLQVKQVFFTGGLTSGSELVRDEIWKAFRGMSLCESTVTHHPEAYFLKHGTFLAVLGSLLPGLKAD